jgi:hypothetical protein
MRIRTDEKPHRERTIKEIADHYGCNKTRALLLAADQVPAFHAALEDALQMDSLTRSQRRELAERFSKARGIEIDINEEITVNVE